MTVRILFLGEGASDSGITTHVQRIATERGIDTVITDPLIDRLPPPKRRDVSTKLRTVKSLGGIYDLVVMHRDADREGRQSRLSEIRQAMDSVMPDVAHIPVIPVRMTEAWLLLDEQAIRHVAGNPNGRMSLSLPSTRKVESIPDPKARLQEVLCTASGLCGQRRKRFRQRFPHQRRQLLDRIDPTGPICEVPSWRAFTGDLDVGLKLVTA